MLDVTIIIVALFVDNLKLRSCDTKMITTKKAKNLFRVTQ